MMSLIETIKNLTNEDVTYHVVGRALWAYVVIYPCSTLIIQKPFTYIPTGLLKLLLAF